MFSRHLTAFPLLMVVLAAFLAFFAACGDDDEEEGPGPTTAAASPEIDVSNVPELQDGLLTIGSDIAYAPIEYYEEGTNKEAGMDVDLARAMAAVMGVDVKFEQVADFAGIVGDLKTKRYDIIMSSISITPQREQEIDFVPYFGPVGTGILTPKGNPDGFQKLEDLCGKKVGAQAGTYQVDQMTALNDDACKDNQIDVQTFPDNPAAVQELNLGRIAAALMDDPVAAYAASQSEGKLELAATGFEAAEYGIGVRKDSQPLNAALDDAFQAIVDNGEYDRILEKWEQTQFALKG